MTSYILTLFSILKKIANASCYIPLKALSLIFLWAGVSRKNKIKVPKYLLLITRIQFQNTRFLREMRSQIPVIKLKHNFANFTGIEEIIIIILK